MATQEATIQVPHAGPAHERRALARSALRVFAREGWQRSDTEAVAAEAGVDASTVRRYYKDKEQLFLGVLLESTASVSAALTAIAERHLTRITDLEPDLIAFGLAWQSPIADYPDHFALVRRISAEVSVLPQIVMEIWQNAGPRPARRELARHLQRLSEEGVLAIEDGDADLAAGRFILLTSTGIVQRTFHGTVPLGEREIEQHITDGVRDFLSLYRPAGRPSPDAGA